MDNTTHGNIAQRQTVSGSNWSGAPGNKRIALFDTSRRDDVAALAICILQERDVGGTIRIIFKPLNRGIDAILVPAKVHYAIFLLLPATYVPGGYSAVVIASPTPVLRFEKGFVGRALVKVGIDNLDDEPSTG
jgi:hypothetical protein